MPDENRGSAFWQWVGRVTQALNLLVVSAVIIAAIVAAIDRLPPLGPRLGDWQRVAVETPYQAETDGFLLAMSDRATPVVRLQIETGPAENDLTLRAKGLVAAMTPVRQGEYYRVTNLGEGEHGSATAYWIPLE